MDVIELKGITWDHSRGISPLLVCSQRFSELHPRVRITWDKRTLQQFADHPIEALTNEYDLLIIDHPWVGCAAARRCVLPLDQYLPAAFLEEQADNSVGNSHYSYNYDGHQWALAIDAAAPAASYRPDLFEKNGFTVPRTWEELLGLAKMGVVAMPAIPIDMLMNFYTFCLVHGEEPFATPSYVISNPTGEAAINTMKALYQNVDRDMFQYNPVRVAELMSSTDRYWYCPLSYCYSNYSRKGFARFPLNYTSPVEYNNKTLKTTIGGTGLAISATSKHPEAALEFAAMVASPDWQRTLYVESGGQPGHRAAWEDDRSNQVCRQFFTNLLPVLDNGYTRPRYNGYLFFQDHAGDPLQKCIMENGDPGEALKEMNRIYQQSLEKERSMSIA